MIDATGIHIGRPFRNISGILSGQFTHVSPNEIERIDRLFNDEAT
jgi:circadian clock protein KaiC